MVENSARIRYMFEPITQLFLYRLMKLRNYLIQAGIIKGFGVDDTTCVVLRPGFEMEIIGTSIIPVNVTL
jgi:hypothetical protein